MEARKRQLLKVCRRLVRAEGQIRLQGPPQEALDMPAAPPPPATTSASTQTEGPSPPLASNSPTPQLEDAPMEGETGLPPAMPSAPADQTSPVPPLTVPPPVPPPVLPSPTFEEGPTMPLGEAKALPPAPAPAPPSTVPPPLPPPPTIEVQGPTPQNSQEGEKATGLLEVPSAPALSAPQAGPSRQSRSRSRSPVDPATLRRSPRLASPGPSIADPTPPPLPETTPGTVTEPTVPRRSPRIVTPTPSPGSLKRSATPGDKGPAKKRRV